MRTQMMTKEELLKQSVDYFKDKPGFTRAFARIKDKYKSLGKMGGTIYLDNLSEIEKEALSGLLNENCYKDSVKISLNKFEKAIQSTKFEGLTLIEILESYYDKEIVTKKEGFKTHEMEKVDFFNEILCDFEGTIGVSWFLYAIESKKSGYLLISQKYNTDKKQLKKNLSLTIQAIDKLPVFENKIERLALFASKTSKNPHAFDDNKDSGKFLLYAICYTLKLPYPKNAEDKMEVLFKAGLIKDEISNFTMTSGLLAYKKENAHPGWGGFYNSKEPINLSLWNLSCVDKVVANKNKVFIFENPTVFSEILYQDYKENISIICTYGQIKLASLVLLDKLVENGAVLFYSGDFDPEGLQIADKLKSRYADSLILLRYDLKDYNKAISKNKPSQARLSKLNSLKDNTLIQMGEYIKENKYAGYQESIIEDLIEDIRLAMENEF
jgi:uncharacterized protein (TIGR02679 family)